MNTISSALRKPRLVWIVVAALAGASVSAGAAWGVSGLQETSTTQSTTPDGEQEMSGLWTGSSYVTMKRGTPDVSIGYTMRADFWFRVDDEGAVSGHGYAVYQPTFKADGLNAKIGVAKTYANGVAGLLPGGALGLAKAAIDTASSAGIAGIVGVKGDYKDPQPVRSGEITGRVDEKTGEIHIDWVDEEQGADIPITVSLAYIDEKIKVTDEELSLWTPWHEPGTISEGSDGWLAVSDSEQKSEGSEDEAKGSVTQHWTAHRVGSVG